MSAFVYFEYRYTIEMGLFTLFFAAASFSAFSFSSSPAIAQPVSPLVMFGNIEQQSRKQDQEDKPNS